LPLNHPDLRIEGLRRDKLVVCLRRDHPLAESGNTCIGAERNAHCSLSSAATSWRSHETLATCQPSRHKYHRLFVRFASQ
jgi:DNA-binding transcriptional LysR family regulator